MFCQIFRWFIGCCVDDARTPGRLTAWHISHCEDCRKYYNGQLEIAGRLERGKVFCHPPETTGYRNIIDSLPDDGSRSNATGSAFPFLKRLAAASTAIVILLAAGIFTLHRLSDRHPAPPATPEPAVNADMIAAELKLSFTFDELLNYHSLERELKAIKTDTLAATGFLMDYAGIRSFEE